MYINYSLQKIILTKELCSMRYNKCYRQISYYCQVRICSKLLIKALNVVFQLSCNAITRSSHPELFLRKDVLKMCSRFTREYPYRSLISVKLQSNFIEIALRHRCSPVNLLHIFRTPFPRNTSGWVLLLLCLLVNSILRFTLLLCYWQFSVLHC